MHLAIRKLDALFARQLADSAAWAEISETIEARRKLCETEAKRQVMLQTMLTQEQAMAFMGAICSIVTTHVTDKHTLSQILASVRALVTREPQLVDVNP
jgi:hypothetical protein